MNQLSFLNTTISKEVKRKAEKLMSRYKILDAIIESKKMDLEPRLTQNPEPSEIQRGNQFYSSVENSAITEFEIEEYVRTKRKLHLVFDSLKPIQQHIWEDRYILGKRDVEVYNDLQITDKTYYRLKREMQAIVAEAFGLINNVG
ncbi:ArpU family phage packaging/lysis transcriptional regulator [Peribacillus frigoritolerans]|uniref:ArpU family phage packaging/lysis transcriptional regulator n=1 Tax=Peribacillus frigoritolerans TaxID=450367 RepID=UPI002EC12938|nr:ArpU family phage packaging/lysis transcriptional regulator [Peribacillus frigoritolerans]